MRKEVSVLAKALSGPGHLWPAFLKSSTMLLAITAENVGAADHLGIKIGIFGLVVLVLIWSEHRQDSLVQRDHMPPIPVRSKCNRRNRN